MDRRIRQTPTATPAKPGGLPLTLARVRLGRPASGSDGRGWAPGNKLKQTTPKRQHDSASQSLLKTIVLRLEDYFLGTIAVNPKPMLEAEASDTLALQRNCLTGRCKSWRGENEGIGAVSSPHIPDLDKTSSSSFLQGKIDMDAASNSKFYDDAKKIISLSSIGFINASYEKLADCPCAGSGTLARIGLASGILTATHVTEQLRSLPAVGIVRFTGPSKQAMTISIKLIRVISYGQQPWSQEGPDIAFMVLPHKDVSALEAYGCVFLDLVSRRVQLESQDTMGRALYLLSGMVGEKTMSTVVSDRAARVTSGALVDCVNVGPRVSRGPFDYVDCDSLPDESFIPPESYQGMSGGGLFVAQVETTQDRTESITRIWPVRVNFWQSAVSEGRRTITCHYADSVYVTLVDKVQQESSAF